MDVDLRSPGYSLACAAAAYAALVVALAVLAAAPASAAAAIQIHPSTGDPTAPPLGVIKKGKCNKFGDLWLGGGKSTNEAYRLHIEVDDWEGYGQDYPLFYGTNRPAWFELKGPNGPFSNRYPIPGTPPGVVGGGAISFGGKKGKRLSIGFVPAVNEDFTAGVSIVGTMKCKYPKKR